jgi:tRNA A37 threonylcarbamoyladenosine dehydratase
MALVDMDHVAESNINRQMPRPSIERLGIAKVFGDRGRNWAHQPAVPRCIPWTIL